MFGVSVGGVGAELQRHLPCQERTFRYNNEQHSSISSTIDISYPSKCHSSQSRRTPITQLQLTACVSTPSTRPSSAPEPGSRVSAKPPISSYTDNGGSIIGIAGDDFVVLAGDTRHTSGYNINSRMEKKVFRLGESSSLVLATVGFGADAKDIADTMRRAVDVWSPFPSL